VYGAAVTLLLIVVGLTVGVSATCSLLEATLMSTRLPTLEAARTGPHGSAAEELVEMKRNIAAPTAAILIMNTVANTAGATLAGSLAVDAFGPGALGVFSVLFTLAILFLAEIVPKTLGATQWRMLWRFIVWPLAALQRLLAPAVWVTEKTASALVGGHASKPTTEGEIAAMIRLGATVGEVSPTELELMTSVMRFDDMRVSEVIVPRHEVKSLTADTKVRDALELAGRHLHTRYPVCGESLEDARSLVHLKDLSSPTVDPDSTVGDHTRPMARIPATMPLSALLRQMQRNKQHMALAIDEHGSAAGVVTLENVLEQIVGAVQDEFDDEARVQGPDAQGARVLPGTTPLRVVAEMFELPLQTERAETLNGWIVDQLRRLPAKGDEVRHAGILMRILEVRRDQASSVRICVEEDAAGDADATPGTPPPESR